MSEDFGGIRGVDVTSLYYSICSLNPLESICEITGPTFADYETFVTRPQFREIIENGKVDKRFRRLVKYFISELQYWNGFTEIGNISGEEDKEGEFVNDVHRYLKTTGINPYLELLQLNSDFTTAKSNFNLLEYLSNEVKGSRIYFVMQKKEYLQKLDEFKRSIPYALMQRIATSLDLLRISGTVKFPNGIPIALTKINEKIQELLPSLPSNYIKPLVDCDVLTSETINKLQTINQTFQAEYKQRKDRMLHSFKITADSLFSSSRLREFQRVPENIHALQNELMRLQIATHELLSTNSNPSISLEFDLKNARAILVDHFSESCENPILHSRSKASITMLSNDDSKDKEQQTVVSKEKAKKKKKKGGKDVFKDSYFAKVGKEELEEEIEEESTLENAEEMETPETIKSMEQKDDAGKGQDLDNNTESQSLSKKDKQKIKQETKKGKRLERKQKKLSALQAANEKQRTQEQEQQEEEEQEEKEEQ